MMLSTSRGWCEMHYTRWRAWGDPSCPTRKAAALALSTAMAACATAQPLPLPAPICEAPLGMVLMPREMGAQAMRDLKELDDALDACVKFADKCRVRNNCS